MKSTASYRSPLAQTCVEHLVVWLDRGLVMVPTRNKPLQSCSGSDQDYLLSVTVFTPAQTPISPFHILTPDNKHNRIRISSTFAGSHMQHTTIDCPGQTCPHGSEILCMVRARGDDVVGTCTRQDVMLAVPWIWRTIPASTWTTFVVVVVVVRNCSFSSHTHTCVFFFVVKRQLHASLVIHALNLSLWTHSGRFSALRGGK